MLCRATVMCYKDNLMLLHGRHTMQVALALPSSNGNGGQVEHQFCGTFEHSKDDMDCVLLFDGRSFRMEALAGRINNLK